MKNADYYLNNYVKEELLAAFDEQNVCVSYSGDYRVNILSQVHRSVELLFVEQGEAEYEINGQSYPVRKNTVLIIGATDRHRFHFKKVPYIRYGLTLLPSFLQTLPMLSGFLNVYETPDREAHERLMDIEEGIFQRLIRILWDLREETQEEKSGGDDMIYALLLELTVLLGRLLGVKEQDTGGAYETMREIKGYIDLHFSEDLSLKELSRRFYLQPNTISKNFSRIWGRNINQYIHSVRITNAVRLLETREVSITELAEMVGYGNVNTFLRQFREKMEVSPLQYKKRRNQAMAAMDTRQLFE